MSQFAILRSKDIVGFIEDDTKGIVTVFLSSGGCCVILASTVINTLESYGESDLDVLFNEYVWNCSDNSDTIVFGDGTLYNNIDTSPKEVPVKLCCDKKEPPKPKKPKF